ncbi:restriction endonuclease-related protein [Amycolatopsis magusensis]|uniref:REase associating with pPIWI RE domain-containing protein n=1 Tax=Amycolatopsis magusensis TaxID=882444 RepID=A0ABS4Q6X3_9PSEU|nr:hypothetical protein [Amycolatopsis magusensis]MBP2186875.1 hypothetical protein [Amycolatopsis magusensis]
MTTENEDEQVLGAVSTALVALDELGDLATFRMPYPPAVQRTMDRLTLHCLRRDARPPSSVPGLIRWGYDRPLGLWPLVLPPDVYPEHGLLLDELSGAPTALCHEIALQAETANPFLEVSRQVKAMAALADEHDRAPEYRTLREVLADHLVLTNDGFNDVRFFASIRVLDDHLTAWYVPIGPGYEVDGEIHACAGCGGPLLPAGEDWWCEREECAIDGIVTPGARWDRDAQVLVQGDRRHRQFVAGPGRAAQRFGAELAASGVEVEHWPVSGPGDLRVTTPAGRIRSAQLVDWHSPALLGRAIAASVAGHSADSMHWVVARYRTDADPAYLRIAREHATTAMIFSEAGFTDLLHDEAGAHA